MNILLIEQEYFNNEVNAMAHTSASSLQVAHALRDYEKGQVYILARQNSLYEKTALALGFECLHEVEGFASSLKFAHLLKQKDITCLYSFDVSSARLVRSTHFWHSHLIHIHSENRYSENQNIFQSKAFEKVQKFIFADQTFREYYAPSFVSNDGQGENFEKVSIMPLYQPLMDYAAKEYSLGGQPLNSIEKENRALEDLPTASNPKKMRFFILGPLKMQAELERLLEAFAIFQEKEREHSSFELYFLGFGDEVESIVELAKIHGIDEKIAIFANIEAKFELTKNDLCIVLGQKDEYLFYPILWAWQHGLALFLTARLRYSDILHNYENVCIADAHSTESLYISLEKFIKDEKMRNRMLDNGRKTLEKLYTFDNLKAYLNFFNSL